MRATDFVKSYFDAWNHRDPEGVADHVADDGIVFDIPENAQRSHDELITHLIEFFDRHRHRYELIGDIQTSRNALAFQYKVCPSGGAVEGAGATAYRGAEFMTLHGDAATTITDYYDIPGIGRASTNSQLALRNAPKYAKSGLSGDQMLAYKDRVEQFMTSEQAYLRSDLTLPKLATAVDCSVNHLSQVINSGFGMSFFDYLNQFRIEHAKDLLSEVDGHSDAILNIAFTVGFNSNSAFYAAFKKRVGQTPAQYRRTQSKESH